ncbi:MAG: glycosyltransferase family 1 protein [Streptomycetaceae bacterium]|nr:MAG: glycosyltransferase family 1 protein [Streptomycetaceae bacterium]
MKIVHIANFYGPKSGGIRTTLHHLGRGYQELGHEFTFVVPGNGFYCEETPSGRRITVPSVRLPFSGGYRIIRSNRDLRKLLTTLQPHRIEISDRFTLSSIGIWARNRKIPAVVFSHESLTGLASNYFPVSIQRMVNWHNRRLAGRFDYVITTTKFAAKEFIDIDVKNVVQVPLGVDLVSFTPHALDKRIHDDLSKGADYLIVHVGRMSPEKKPMRSIETIAELQRRGINAHLVYIGIGPMWNQMRDAAKDLPVTFLGYIADRNRVAAILASSDVSLAPGPIETFCLAALESIASGTPVVASHSSAVGEFLAIDSDSPAGATAANDAISFSDEVEKLLRGNPVEISLNCRKQAELFPWTRTIELLLAADLKSEEVLPSPQILRAA